MLTGTIAMTSTIITVLRGLNGTVWNVVADGTIRVVEGGGFGVVRTGVGVGVVATGAATGAACPLRW